MRKVSADGGTSISWPWLELRNGVDGPEAPLPGKTDVRDRRHSARKSCGGNSHGRGADPAWSLALELTGTSWTLPLPPAGAVLGVVDVPKARKLSTETDRMQVALN